MRTTVVQEKRQLPPTPPPAPNEIIAPLLFAGAAEGGRLVLALCDVDGERWGMFGAAGKTRYLWASDGFIVVLDPLQMPGVRELLGDRLPEDAPPEDAMLDQFTALSYLDVALQQRRAPPYATPLAVVVSKGDVVWEVDPVLREALRNSPFYHPGGEHPKYDMALHWRVQFAVREFLRRQAPGVVDYVEKSFRNFAYFCVAPTGCRASPEGGEKRFARFAPWRVEEPVLWLFSQLGVIPTV